MKNNIAILNIRELITLKGPKRARIKEEMKELGIVHNGALVIENGKIIFSGKMEELNIDISKSKFEIINLKNEEYVVMPGFVDSHTHPVFAETREEEYEMRIMGVSYEEIAKRGGGILNSAKKLRESSKDKLKSIFLKNCEIFIKYGTTTIEAKSGYGLTLKDEIKMLEVIDEGKKETPLDVFPTFLGAHAIPMEYKENPEKYVDLIVNEMIPEVVRRKLALFCDVFCEKGFFDIELTERILKKATQYGLKIKIHADELYSIGASSLAAKYKALSADHLEKIRKIDMENMAKSGTIATLLPGTAYNLGLTHYPPAREIIENGVPVALATDFNPGSCFTPNMQLILSIACTQMKMTPAETIVAATINGAYALDIGDKVGSLESGKDADLIILNCKNYKMIPYMFGINHVKTVIKKGKIILDS